MESQALQNKSKPSARIRLIFAAGFVVLSTLLVFPFFYSKTEVISGRRVYKMLGTHDLLTHVKMMQQFELSLSAGIIEPRWFSEVNNGYGSATFNYYPRLFYYVTTLVNIPFHDWHTTLLILSIVCLAASGGSMYWMARMFYSRPASVIAALLYVLLPYHLLDLYWRGALTEYAGFILLPLILRFAIKVGTEPRTLNFAGLGLFYGIHLMTHMPVALMFSYGMVFFAIIWAAQKRDIRILFRIGAGMAVGVLLSATYWLPAVLETSLVYEWASRMFPYHSVYITPLEGANAFDTLIILTFKYNLVLVIVAALALKYRRRDDQEQDKGFSWDRMWVIMAGFALFMCNALSYDISRLLPKIQAAVPPFRWLAIAALFSALLVAAVVERWRAAELRLLARVALVVILALNVWLAVSKSLLSSLVNGPMPASDIYLDAGFIPAGAAQPGALRDSPRIELQPEGGLAETTRWDPENREIRLKTDQPATVRIKTYNFPGWKASIDGKPTTISSDNDGVQTISVEPGTHVIDTAFKNTRTRTAAQLVSLFGLSSLVGLAIYGRRRVAADQQEPKLKRETAHATAGAMRLLGNRRIAVAVVAAIVAAGVAIALAFARPGHDKSNSGSRAPAGGSASPSGLPADSDASLFIPNASTISVAVDPESLDQLVESLARHDADRIDELSHSGKVLVVENRTRVRVLERSAGKVKVRLSEGRYQWAEGWVPDPWVR